MRQRAATVDTAACVMAAPTSIVAFPRRLTDYPRPSYNGNLRCCGRLLQDVPRLPSAKPHDAPKDLALVLCWGALPSTSTHSQIPRSTFQVSEGTPSPLQTSPPRADANNDRIQRKEDLIGIPKRQLFKSRAAFHFDSYLRLPSGLFFLCRPSSSYLLHRLRSGLASSILPASRRMPGATLREFHSLSII